ncbi:junctional adhesion molecule-like isoform X1, partial [Clarias magur]
SRETSTHWRKTDTTLEQPQSETPTSPPSSSTSLVQVFGVLVVLLLVIPGIVAAFICWRHRGGRCGENVITEGRQGCKGKQEDQ